MGSGSERTPLFSFGVIADVQYADVDDGFNFTGTSRRYYRSSLRLLADAQQSWSESAVPPRFVLQLGDVIDGVNKRDGASQRALDAVLAEVRRGGPAEVHHVWGNHELYNFRRGELLQSGLNSSQLADRGPGAAPPRPDIYAYLFRPEPGFLFVLLDGYDVSPLGREPHSDEYRSAMTILRQHNPNHDLNCPPASTVEDVLSPRFSMFNGGFSVDQLDWLDWVLTVADQQQEKVFLFCHVPVHPGAAASVCLSWNFEDVLSVVRGHGSVVCYMSGHDHDGGYCQDREGGAHHLTLEGVIETPPHSNAFATVVVYKDRMEVHGVGRTPHRELLFSAAL